MTRRNDRILLAVEVAFGVLPITIVGGFYSILGLLFGTVSVTMSVLERAFAPFAFWFGILALATGGFFGIVGLWTVVAISAASRPPSSSMIRVAIAGSAVGVLTAVAALILMVRGAFDGRPVIVYGLVASIIVALHRAPAIGKLM
jgi:hypothetical protein